MFDDVRSVEAVVCRELKRLREAERWLCSAFETLPADPATSNSMTSFLYQLAQADERLDRLELLLDIMDSSVEPGTAVA